METTLLAVLGDRFTAAVHAAYPQLPPEEAVAEVTQSTNPKFGHYQCNSALKLAKSLKKPPRQVAEELLAAVDTSDGAITVLDIAGPGFINITLDNAFLSKRLNAILDDPYLGVPPVGRGHRVVIDFSSPNVAKEMHVGHLRSTIIGDAIARLLEFLRYDVVRINHVGDWGTQFGMLIAYLKEKHPEVLQDESIDLVQLVDWYRESKKQFDADPAFKERAQLEVVSLQGGNPQSRAAWESICAISRNAYQKIYDLLDVRLTERGESFYNPLLPGVVADLERQGLITVSEGAKVIYLEGFVNRDGDPLPLMIQKSDGGYLYGTTDMAALRHRVEEEKADWLIYVTDLGQATHFAMVYQAGERAGYVDRSKVRIDHVPFGLVLGPDGKKFRTRAGDTEPLIGLLTAAIEQARLIAQQRGEQMSLQEIEETAKVIGLGAVKYADLASQRTKDYTFSYDRMLRLEGNTAPFLLYAYVRMAGIKRRVGADLEHVKQQSQISLSHPTEIALGLHLCRFPEALAGMARDLLPNRLCDYLYTLAELFHAFHRDCRVAGSKEQQSRLLLCEVAARILKTGLHILGLETVERM